MGKHVSAPESDHSGTCLHTCWTVMAEHLRTLTEHVLIPDDVWSAAGHGYEHVWTPGLLLAHWLLVCGWTCLNTWWRPWLKVGLCLVFAQSVWGSFWNAGRWGYQCCHSFIKESYCTGQAGKEAHEVGTCFFVCAFILGMCYIVFFCFMFSCLVTFACRFKVHGLFFSFSVFLFFSLFWFPPPPPLFSLHNLVLFCCTHACQCVYVCVCTT